MSRRIKNRRNEEGISLLASNLRRIRERRGLTIQELANKLDADYSQISRIERSLVNPSVSILFDIADVLEIEASELLESHKV